MSAVFSLESGQEERRKVRLRHHGDDTIVPDFDDLKDEPREVVALLLCGRSGHRRPLIPLAQAIQMAGHKGR